MPKPSTAPADRNPNDHLSIWRTLLVQMIGHDVDTAHRGDRRYLRAVDDLFWGSGSVAACKLVNCGEGDELCFAADEAIAKGRDAMVRLGKLVVLYYATRTGEILCPAHDGSATYPPTPWCFHCCWCAEGDIPLSAGLIAAGATALPVEHFVVSAAQMAAAMAEVDQ